MREVKRPKDLYSAEPLELIEYIEFVEAQLVEIRSHVGLASMLSKEEQVYNATNTALERIFEIQDAGWEPRYAEDDYDGEE